MQQALAAEHGVYRNTCTAIADAFHKTDLEKRRHHGQGAKSPEKYMRFGSNDVVLLTNPACKTVLFGTVVDPLGHPCIDTGTAEPAADTLVPEVRSMIR